MDCDVDCCRPALPAEMPVMVLQDCHLFPGCLLPLYIYEERYRKMLAHALGSNRMFCIGNRDGGEDAPISTHSTAGLVRACVQQGDGTSHLLLLGLQRIRLGEWRQVMPFRIAAVEPLETIREGEDATYEQLKAEALGLFSSVGGQAAQLRKVLEENKEPEMVCDVLSYHFTRCPKLQQRLLAEASLTRRYEMVIEALKKTSCK